MDLAMMAPAQWDSELIADLAPEAAQLGEPHMVGIRGPPAANQAWLFDDVADVVAVADAPWFGERQNAFVDLLRSGRRGRALLRRRCGRVLRFSRGCFKG